MIPAAPTNSNLHSFNMQPHTHMALPMLPPTHSFNTQLYTNMANHPTITLPSGPGEIRQNFSQFVSEPMSMCQESGRQDFQLFNSEASSTLYLPSSHYQKNHGDHNDGYEESETEDDDDSRSGKFSVILRFLNANNG